MNELFKGDTTVHINDITLCALHALFVRMTSKDIKGVLERPWGEKTLSPKEIENFSAFLNLFYTTQLNNNPLPELSDSLPAISSLCNGGSDVFDPF